MTIASEITRIKTNIENAYIKAEEKGATMPEVLNSDSLASTIETISSGGTGGTIEKRGGWLVPEIYTQIDQAVALEDDLYNIALDKHVNYYGEESPMAVFGFMLHKGYYTEIRITFGIYIYLLKCSTGEVYYCTDFENGQISVTLNNVDNSNNDKYFIAYCREIAQLDSSYFEIDSLPTGTSIPLPRICQYYSFKGQLPSGTNLSFPNASLISFNIIGEIEDKYKYNQNITGFQYVESNDDYYYEYIPPINLWSQSNLMNNISYNQFSKTSFKCLPDGLDLSQYTDTTNALQFGGSTNTTASQIRKNSTITRLYVKLPATNITFNSGILLTKDNWQYLAENAPTVTDCTITMKENNISVCGGTDSEIIQTFISKGWTVN